MYLAFVDDSEERHAAVERILGDDHCILHAFSYEEAVSLLLVSPIKIGCLCLDHDLGEEFGGSDVASYMLNILDAERFPAQVIVHSLNPPGAENIASKCKTAGIPTRVIPFGENMLSWLKNDLAAQ